MPEGEGGEARGRLSCSRVISLWWPKDPMVLSHSRSESWGVEEFEVESSQHILVVQRTARLAGSIRREAAYEAPVFWRAQQLRPRWRSRPRFERAAFGCGIESRKAHALAERRGSRGARVCEMRQQTTDDRRLSAERLNDRRRNRHRRHFDEQRERARRRPAVAGRAEPGLDRPRRRSRPGGRPEWRQS